MCQLSKLASALLDSSPRTENQFVKFMLASISFRFLSGSSTLYLYDAIHLAGCIFCCLSTGWMCLLVSRKGEFLEMIYELLSFFLGSSNGYEFLWIRCSRNYINGLRQYNKLWWIQWIYSGILTYWNRWNPLQ